MTAVDLQITFSLRKSNRLISILEAMSIFYELVRYDVTELYAFDYES